MSEARSTPDRDSRSNHQITSNSAGRGRYTSFATVLVLLVIGACDVMTRTAVAQSVMVVGTRHLSHLDPPPSSVQLRNAIEALSTFAPTQVCVERMGGARIEQQLTDPKENGFTFQPETHGRPLASLIVPIALKMQLNLEISARDARIEARTMVAQWDTLGPRERVRAIALLLAGFEFHSAVLNWSYLDSDERDQAADILDGIEPHLNEMQTSIHEVYSIGVPLARAAGLHILCTADALEDESAGMKIATRLGGVSRMENPEVEARFAKLTKRSNAAWKPDSGPDALIRMLRFFNGDEYVNLDRRLQWETLLEFDNDAGAFRRRLMYWHARTAEISAELYRALARGPDERVLLIIGSAHRPFTEAHLRSQPWVNVVPASSLLESAD